MSEKKGIHASLSLPIFKMPLMVLLHKLPSLRSLLSEKPPDSFVDLLKEKFHMATLTIIRINESPGHCVLQLIRFS